MKTTTSLLILFIAILFSSCGLRPIPSEHNLVYLDKERISLNELGNGKILIYNDANYLHTGDNTSNLNIIMDGKNLGQLRAKDYAIVHLEKGQHTFNITHLDVVKMRSEHEVTVSDTTKVIRVKPTIISNKLEVVNQMPKNWDKYIYMNDAR